MLKRILLAAFFLMPMGLIAQNRLTPNLLWEMGRVGGGLVSPDGKQVLYTVRNYELQENRGYTSAYVMPIAGGEAKKINIDGSPNSLAWRPDGAKITFLRKGQLFEVNVEGDGLQLVSEQTGIIAYHYSANMNTLAFAKEVKLRKNTKELYPDLPKAEALVIDDLMYRHWDHWSDDKHNHVFVAPYSNGKIDDSKSTDIMKGELFDTPTTPFGGGEDFALSPDGKMVAYVCKKKTGKEYAISTNTDIYLYNIGEGTTQNLTKGMLGYDTQPSFSANGKQIAWLSMEHDGYESDKNDIYIYDFASAQKSKLTGDYDETVSSFIWKNDGKGLYFLAGVNATYQLFEAKFPRKGYQEFTASNIRQITEGDHNYKSLHQAGKSLIGLKQNMSMSNELFKVDIKKGKETQLTFINKHIYDRIKLGKVEKRWIPTSDGKKMLTWVIYPPNFDPNKKYPALLYCQGGPQSAVSQFFSFRWNFQLMAANDYIIVAPNRRGLPSFGTEWNEAISGDWGGQPMKDYFSAIDAVSAEPYVDEDRLGAIGASYGGYSVYMLAGIHQKRFKTFISHCGLFDLKSWYGTTEELFFANWDIGGPYWENPQPIAYQKFSPSDYVQNWDTPILVIHGGKDFRVPESQGMQAFQAAQLKGIHSRFLYFPNEGHWVLSPQNGIIWHTEFFKWLDETLK
ncbi:peptidase S9 [Fulvitalea axinellae]|uniref:Peptidase S9 n=1 Tax=Fulvitalea axinellae TaxID=1182444 RepID=A0AAU9CRR9_9BACT|nr:peptidase S9 [Fulvitalea axinellae]